jgi:hypothetical protein
MRSPIEIFQTSLKKSRVIFILKQIQQNLHKREDFVSDETKSELFELFQHLPRTERQPLLEKFEKLRIQHQLWKDSQNTSENIIPGVVGKDFEVTEETLISDFTDSQKEFLQKTIENYRSTLWSQGSGLFKSGARFLTGSGHQGGHHYWEKWQESDSPNHFKSAVKDIFDLKTGSLQQGLQDELEKQFKLENVSSEQIIERIQKEFFDKKQTQKSQDSPVDLWSEYAETLESLQQQLELSSATFNEKLSLRNMENWRSYLEMGLILWKKRSIAPLMQSTHMLQTLGQALGVSVPFATAAGIAGFLARIPTPITLALAGGGWLLAYRNQAKHKREIAIAGIWLLLYQRSQLLKQRAALELAADDLRRQLKASSKNLFKRAWQKIKGTKISDRETEHLRQTLETLEDLMNMQTKLGLA